MFISKINDVLDVESLAKARKIIQASEFTDGRISGGTTSNKKNLELSPETEKYVEVLKIVEQAVRENVEFNVTAFPRSMTRPIISRYDIGMFYKEHVDLPVMGLRSSGLAAVGSNYIRSDLSMSQALRPTHYPRRTTRGDLLDSEHVPGRGSSAGGAQFPPSHENDRTSLPGL